MTAMSLALPVAPGQIKAALREFHRSPAVARGPCLSTWATKGKSPKRIAKVRLWRRDDSGRIVKAESVTLTFKGERPVSSTDVKVLARCIEANRSFLQLLIDSLL